MSKYQKKKSEMHTCLKTNVFSSNATEITVEKQ